MANHNENWENIRDLIHRSGHNLNIFEEEIDLSVQKEYFTLAGQIIDDPPIYEGLRTRYIEQINDLFSPNIDDNTKKEMLVVLSTINDIAIYRSIESFSKTNETLRKWAIIALQQSRMLIQSDLVDEPEIYISTGLGGRGKLLRYFCVLFNNKQEKLQDFQQKILINETEQALKSEGELEKTSFFKSYSTLQLLLPIDTNLNIFFEELIKECNLYGNFLHENMIITNVKKLTQKEINKVLKSR